MRFIRANLHGLGGLLLASTLVACGSEGPPTATVTGTVTMDGKPVDGAGILIEPTDGGMTTSATTDGSGNFTVEALIGPSKVAIAKSKTIGANVGSVKNEEGVELTGDTTKMRTEFITPVKYASPLTSGLTLDVQHGMAPVTFELSGK